MKCFGILMIFVIKTLRVTMIITIHWFVYDQQSIGKDECHKNQKVILSKTKSILLCPLNCPLAPWPCFTTWVIIHHTYSLLEQANV